MSIPSSPRALHLLTCAVLPRYRVQEDFTLMVEGTDGRYYLQAGAVVIAGSWRLEDKMGLPLEDIHTTGNVPQCTPHIPFTLSPLPSLSH